MECGFWENYSLHVWAWWDSLGIWAPILLLWLSQGELPPTELYRVHHHFFPTLQIPAYPLDRLRNPICSSSPQILLTGRKFQDKTTSLPVPHISSYLPRGSAFFPHIGIIPASSWHIITPCLSSIKPPCFSLDVKLHWPPPVIGEATWELSPNNPAFIYLLWHEH